MKRRRMVAGVTFRDYLLWLVGVVGLILAGVGIHREVAAANAAARIEAGYKSYAAAVKARDDIGLSRAAEELLLATDPNHDGELRKRVVRDWEQALWARAMNAKDSEAAALVAEAKRLQQF